jgi:hypothetical protein
VPGRVDVVPLGTFVAGSFEHRLACDFWTLFDDSFFWRESMPFKAFENGNHSSTWNIPGSLDLEAFKRLFIDYV